MSNITNLTLIEFEVVRPMLLPFVRDNPGRMVRFTMQFGKAYVNNRTGKEICTSPFSTTTCVTPKQKFGHIFGSRIRFITGTNGRKGIVDDSFYSIWAGIRILMETDVPAYNELVEECYLHHAQWYPSNPKWFSTLLQKIEDSCNNQDPTIVGSYLEILYRELDDSRCNINSASSFIRIFESHCSAYKRTLSSKELEQGSAFACVIKDTVVTRPSTGGQTALGVALQGALEAASKKVVEDSAKAAKEPVYKERVLPTPEELSKELGFDCSECSSNMRDDDSAINTDYIIAIINDPYDGGYLKQAYPSMFAKIQKALFTEEGSHQKLTGRISKQYALLWETIEGISPETTQIKSKWFKTRLHRVIIKIIPLVVEHFAVDYQQVESHIVNAINTDGIHGLESFLNTLE